VIHISFYESCVQIISADSLSESRAKVLSHTCQDQHLLISSARRHPIQDSEPQLFKVVLESAGLLKTALGEWDIYHFLRALRQYLALLVDSESR
jgi:hypothetical protein